MWSKRHGLREHFERFPCNLGIEEEYIKIEKKQTEIGGEIQTFSLLQRLYERVVRTHVHPNVKKE